MLTKFSKYLTYCLFDCKDIQINFHKSSNLPSVEMMPREEDSTLSEHRPAKFTVKLRVHFNKWVGSDSMATALTSSGNCSTEQ